MSKSPPAVTGMRSTHHTSSKGKDYKPQIGLNYKATSNDMNIYNTILHEETWYSYSPTYGKVRAWNQSSKAISLYHPPAVLTLIYDNHDVPSWDRELVFPLNQDRNNQSTDFSYIKHGLFEHMKHLNVLNEIITWPGLRSHTQHGTPRCSAGTLEIQEWKHKLLLLVHLKSFSIGSVTVCACKTPAVILQMCFLNKVKYTKVILWQ